MSLLAVMLILFSADKPAPVPSVPRAPKSTWPYPCTRTTTAT
jgi:hypothetical protein